MGPGGVARIPAKPIQTLEQQRRHFNAIHREWLAEQNRNFEQNGLWCDGLVAWQDTSDGAVRCAYQSERQLGRDGSL